MKKCVLIKIIWRCLYFFRVKMLASIVGHLISLGASCEILLNCDSLFASCYQISRLSFLEYYRTLSDQAIRELLFWGDNLRPLNGVLSWPLVFVPSRVVTAFL